MHAVSGVAEKASAGGRSGELSQNCRVRDDDGGGDAPSEG
jgi:hypothetical protein